MRKTELLFILSFFLTINISLKAEDGYRLWLKYDLISNQQKLNQYKELIKGFLIEGDSPTLKATKEELKIGLEGLLGVSIRNVDAITEDRIVIAASYKSSSLFSKLDLKNKLKNIGSEGFIIFNSEINGKKVINITANEDIGVLYGVFHFLRLLQTNQDISNLDIESSPKIKLRLLDHWDNLDRTVERGYAGFSIWDWHKLPDYIDPRYKDYARTNASIGINGAALTNVNANALVLTSEYLEKVKVLADVFRPYGIKVYLTARFSAPVEIGARAMQKTWNSLKGKIDEDHVRMLLKIQVDEAV